MKILYAIQGTGNGHLSRAMEIVPALQERGEVDVLLSGIQADLDLPFEVKFRFNGMSYIFGKNGGIDFLDSYRKNKFKKFWKEVKSLPIEDYDLVISDFEPVSCWAAYRKKKPVIGLSNQAAVMAPKVPRPKKEDVMGKFILKYYAPVSVKYGFHFQRYNQNIFTPIIRKAIRELEVSDDGHYLVYLPAYDDQRIIKILSLFPHAQFHVFSKHNDQAFEEDNVKIEPISNEAFLRSLATCRGVLCNAGFGTTTEALFLGKKLLVIPMKNQFEQHCNAHCLKKMGVPVIKSLKKKHALKIENWLSDESRVAVDYPDNAQEIVDKIIDEQYLNPDAAIQYLKEEPYIPAMPK